MIPDLCNALKTLGECSPGQTPREAWQAIKPSGTFLRNSFWWALDRSLPFARSTARQKKIASYILDWQTRSEKAGQQWPPTAITIKPVILPAPNPL